ncbi:ASCH domain-containing protein [Microbacterium sp. AZCO]|uniref:ASCH domain-containing protein n=1 Tax=Microbacterium sp. AZCO TaxID=3142976 RepID=UPI0031F37531
MWAQYARARPEAVALSPEYSVERFGDSEGLADELLELVLIGRKRATAGLVAEFLAEGDDVPRIGSHWIACDGRGVPRVIIRSVELRLSAFDDVDAQFAFDEGEDDRSLESWRRNHRRYWERVTSALGTTWSETDEIVLQRFSVVWPPEFADPVRP